MDFIYYASYTAARLFSRNGMTVLIYIKYLSWLLTAYIIIY